MMQAVSLGDAACQDSMVPSEVGASDTAKVDEIDAVEKAKFDKASLEAALAPLCATFLECTVDLYKKAGLIALPIEAGRCSILSLGPNDDDIFQCATLKTNYDFTKVSRVFVDRASTNIFTWGTYSVYIVPVVLTPIHNEKTRLIFPYVYEVISPLSRWVLVNSLGQVVTTLPVQVLSPDLDEPEYYMRVFKCGPTEARSYEKTISAMTNGIQQVKGDSFSELAASIPPLHLRDLDTFWKNLTTEQWCQWLSWGSECEKITKLCYRTAVVLLDQAVEGREAAESAGLRSTFSKFTLVCAIRFVAGQTGCSFEMDTPGFECPLSALRCSLPNWGKKDRPVLPVERWTSFFEPLPSTWAKYEYALAALLEQRCLALLQNLREAVDHKPDHDAPHEPSVRCIGKRARRTARKRGGKKAAAMPEERKRRMPDATLQLSEREEADTDTDDEVFGNTSKMLGPCVEEPPCSWTTGSTKGSDTGFRATPPDSDTEITNEKLDSPSKTCENTFALDSPSGMSESTFASSDTGLRATPPDSDTDKLDSPSETSQNTAAFDSRSRRMSESTLASDVTTEEFSPFDESDCTLRVKNTFLEPFDLAKQEAVAMLRRTKSCSALPLLGL